MCGVSGTGTGGHDVTLLLPATSHTVRLGTPQIAHPDLECVPSVNTSLQGFSAPSYY